MKDSQVYTVMYTFLLFQIKKINVHENESIGEDEVILEFYDKSSDSAVQNKAA